LNWLSIGTYTGLCCYGDEPSGSIIAKNFLKNEKVYLISCQSGYMRLLFLLCFLHPIILYLVRRRRSSSLCNFPYFCDRPTSSHFIRILISLSVLSLMASKPNRQHVLQSLMKVKKDLMCPLFLNSPFGSPYNDLNYHLFSSPYMSPSFSLACHLLQKKHLHSRLLLRIPFSHVNILSCLLRSSPS